jgi:excisionase family DNA binding protein
MYLSTTEAARELGVSARQVRRHAANGRIVAARYGHAQALSSRQVLLMSRTAHRGRNWTETGRRAALELLTSGTTDAVTGSERSRIRTRVRSAEVGALAGQILRGHASLRRAASTEAKRRFKPDILGELGLSFAGGLGVLVSENATLDARRARLALDDSGDIVVVEGTEAHRQVLEALALYAYGDARESAAAARWIATIQATV